MPVMKVCIVGASGKLGQYMIQHALGRGYEVAGVCRAQSVAKLDAFKGRMTVIPGPTDDREVITKAVAGCALGDYAVTTPCNSLRKTPRSRKSSSTSIYGWTLKRPGPRYSSTSTGITTASGNSAAWGN
jgi:nucleoside-diphosphate-sugar epimerase